MSIYLPIAEISINIFLLISLGGVIGFLSGMFGLGGGFLMTPLLIFIGIPTNVAVATSANQIVAASVSGALGHWRQGLVDVKMGAVLVSGGILGSIVGVSIFDYLSKIGQIDAVISVLYFVLLFSIGTLMLVEALEQGTTIDVPTRRQADLHELGHTTMLVKWLDTAVEHEVLIPKNGSNNAQGALELGSLFKKIMN